MVLQSFKKQFPAAREHESLKKHCTLRVGGPADLFYELTNIEELPKIIELAEENSIRYRIIGRGTNVLFTDKGFRGLIIKNLSQRTEIHDNEITADSGTPLVQIIKLAADNNLSGLEPLWGIPGSVGGAVYGNAGVPGTEIGKFVKSVNVFNVSDGVRELNGEDILFKYRWSSLQENHEIVLRVTLAPNKAERQKPNGLLQQISKIRHDKQPIGWSAGSFFKNPSPEKSAGYLIDQAGLKGHRVGDAQISEKHGNFIVNVGNATAAQLLELAEFAKKKVNEKFGIKLEMEVKIIGDL